jgi:hypothetical protein
MQIININDDNNDNDDNHDNEYNDYIKLLNKYKLNLNLFNKNYYHKKQSKKCFFKDCNKT